MFDLALKNILRQKTRTALTIIGITIGIAAIVALGSISEGLRVMISEGLEQASGMITVLEESNSQIFMAFSTSKLSETTVNEISSVDDIKDFVPIVMEIGYLEGEAGFGQPTLFITGVDPEKEKLYTTENIRYKEGEGLEQGDIDVAVVGHTLAEKLDLEIGDTIEFKDTDFEVKGIYEEFGDPGIDSGIMVPIETAKEILDTDEFSVVVVYPEDIDDVDDVARSIEESVDGVMAITTEEFSKQVSQIIDQIQFFTIGIAGISAIVGGLGVMNTMIMSVMERRREIGVLKSVGATKWFVVKLILMESSTISLVGGIVGIMFGYFGSFILETVSEGTVKGIVTPKLALASLGFALILGVVGGLYPSKKAADLDPVEALRYE